MAAILLRRSWNWMSCGPLSPKRRTRRGSGLPSAARRVKWWPMLSETEVKALVAACGKPFPQPTVRGTASLISGLPTRRSYQKNSTQQSERKQVKRRVLERWNNTLRQRLARFVRKTLSFSKSLSMHEACLRLFLHRYNLERAIILT